MVGFGGEGERTVEAWPGLDLEPWRWMGGWDGDGFESVDVMASPAFRLAPLHGCTKMQPEDLYIFFFWEATRGVRTAEL